MTLLFLFIRLLFECCFVFFVILCVCFYDFHGVFLWHSRRLLLIFVHSVFFWFSPSSDRITTSFLLSVFFDRRFLQFSIVVNSLDSPHQTDRRHSGFAYGCDFSTFCTIHSVELLNNRTIMITRLTFHHLTRLRLPRCCVCRLAFWFLCMNK